MRRINYCVLGDDGVMGVAGNDCFDGDGCVWGFLSGGFLL